MGFSIAVRSKGIVLMYVNIFFYSRNLRTTNF